MTITKQQAELWEQRAKMYRLCVGTSVEPHQCMKIKSSHMNEYEICNEGCPSVDEFASNPDWQYQFARGIAEGKPFFEGDTLWLKQLDRNYGPHVVTADFDINDLFAPPLWNPPKRTIRINGKEFPAPEKYGDKSGWIIKFSENKCFFWPNVDDRDSVEQELIKILEGKCD